MKNIKDIIKENIKKRGEISLSEFIDIAMNEPNHGYYIKQKPIGSKGDFVTAPEISQIFGEIIGIWIQDYIQKLSLNEDFQIIDLGGGRGTLLKDISKVINNKNVNYVFIDINSNLIEEQRKSVPKCKHFKDISEIPNLPSIFIGNEFLDVFPIKQFKKKGEHWEEIFITLKNDDFIFCSKELEDISDLQDINHYIPENADFFEVNTKLEDKISEIAKFINKNGGISMFIDYGYTNNYGNSLQAIKKHKFVNPLSFPGESDITSHVNFSHIIYLAKKYNLNYFGPASQRDFFIRMGAKLRLQSLKETLKNKKDKKNLENDLNRIIGKEEMGLLFKVIALSEKNKLIPEGFD